MEMHDFILERPLTPTIILERTGLKRTDMRALFSEYTRRGQRQ